MLSTLRLYININYIYIMSNCNDIIEQKYKDALEKEYRAIGLTDPVIN